MLARQIHGLGNLGLGDLVSIDAADTDTALMHMQHVLFYQSAVTHDSRLLSRMTDMFQ